MIPASQKHRQYASYVGERFGRVSVIDAEKRLPSNGDAAVWWFRLRCECDGREIWRRASCVIHGQTRSCGCLRRQLSSERLIARHAAKAAA